VLTTVASLLLVMRWLDIVWQITPSGGKRFTGVEIAATLALGGIWMFFLVRNLEGIPLLPTHAPLAPAGSGHHRGNGHGAAPAPHPTPA
jgi:hypothetical protein